MTLEATGQWVIRHARNLHESVDDDQPEELKLIRLDLQQSFV
jgi:hypothetical protein